MRNEEPNSKLVRIYIVALTSLEEQYIGENTVEKYTRVLKISESH